MSVRCRAAAAVAAADVLLKKAAAAAEIAAANSSDFSIQCNGLNLETVIFGVKLLFLLSLSESFFMLF